MTVIRFEDARRPAADFRRRARRRRSARNIGTRVLGRLHLWRRRAKERTEVAALDDRTLADIGLSRAEAEFLSDKPFWRE